MAVDGFSECALKNHVNWGRKSGGRERDGAEVYDAVNT